MVDFKMIEIVTKFLSDCMRHKFPDCACEVYINYLDGGTYQVQVRHVEHLKDERKVFLHTYSYSNDRTSFDTVSLDEFTAVKNSLIDASCLSSVTIKESEFQNIKNTLEKNDGNRTATAFDLGISERTLYRKLKEFGLKKRMDKVR